jgi:hypothetical protein
VPLATQAQSYEALNEDFSAAAPEGWVGANTAFADNTATSGSIAWQHASQSINGLPAGHYYADLWLQGRYMWAVTPALDLSLLESAQLAFDLALTVQDGTGAPATVDSGKTVMVLARIGNGSWTKLASWSAADGDSAVASIGGSYTTRQYDLSDYVGKSNVRFAFYAANTTRNGDAVSVHLDNVSVNGVIACQPVTGLVATARTAESITVSWADDVNGAAQFYRVRLLNADGDQVGNSADILATAAFIYTFTGLEASTDYTVEVVTHNSLSIFSDPATLVVRTDCAAKTLPFAEDFESVAVNAAPECWAYTGTGVYVQQNGGSYSIYAHGGTRALRVGPLTGNYTDGYAEIVQMVTLPAMNEPISTMMLSFWLRCGSSYSSSAYGKITVGYLTDPADTSTFVATNAPVLSSSTYTQHYFTFAGAPEGARIAIRASKGNYNSGGAYVFIDDVDLSAPCLPVSGLTASEITDNSITVSWNPFEGAYKYIAKAVKGADTITVDVDGTASSATFENLAMASSYTISVWHLCAESDTSLPSTIVASTPCQTLSLPLSFNFDDLTELPACWESSTTTNTPWKIGTGTTASSYNSAHGGSGKNLAFNGNGRSKNATLVTPVINLEGLVPVLTFWHMQPTWGGDQDVLTIYYRTAEDADWVQLATYTSSITAWTEEIINLPNPTATYQLKFEAAGDYGYGIAIDDLTIVSPTCFPVELTVGEITGTSISVNWEAQASAPLKYIGKAVSGATVVEAEVAGDATALTFEGLNASSTYNISVYTVCAEGDTSSAAVITASTPCATVDLPFAVDFSTMSALPACWTFDNGIAGSSDYIAINSYSSMSKGLRFASYNTYSCIQYAVTPELNAPNPSTVTVVYATYGSGDKLYFGYSTTDANYDSFTWSDAKTTNRNDATYTVDLPAGVKYLAVKYDGNYSYYAIVKSMTLVSPTCFSVTDLTATVANYHNATISWTDAKNEGATYNVVVANSTDTLANLTAYESTSLTIDTLQAFTAYTVTVGVNCADDSEVDDVSATFSTPVMCPTPTNFTVTPTRVAATLTWDNPYVDRFLVVVSATALDAEALAALNEESTNVTVVEGEQSYLATGLERGTEYHFYLRAVCEGATWVSATATTNELTFCEDIANGTAGPTTNLPSHLNYKYALSQTILTPEQVGVTGELQGMSYYRTTAGDATRSIKVWLQPTSKTEFSGTTDMEALNPATATLVYDGAFVSTVGEMYIPFNAPYNYDGTSNLLVIFLDTTGSYISTKSYQAVMANGYQSIMYYADNNIPDPLNPPTAKGRYQNIPYMTFRHCGVLDACPVVENVTAVASVDGSAVISWDRPDADYLSGYKLFVSPVAMTAFDTAAAINVDADATSYTATGLTIGEQYYVYIAAYSVRDAALSQWSDEVSFRVPEACSFPENIVAAVTARGTVTLTWQNGDVNGEQADNYSLIVARAAMTRDELNAATPDAVAIDTTTLVIDTLAPETDYIFYLRNVCDEETRSSWVASNTVTTPAAMPAVLTTVESFNHSSAIVTWVSDTANYADETAWQVAFRQAASSDELSWTVVTEQRYVFWPLESNTEYNLYVRPYNVETGAFGAAAVETVTTNPFGDESSEPCATVAEGSNNNMDVIVCYGSPAMHSYSQILYPAARLTQFVGKQIEKISFRKTTGTTLPSMVVSVAEVEQSAFASAARIETTLTQVFEGTPTLDENIITIEFAEPYTYNGGNLLVNMDIANGTSCTDFNLVGETEAGVIHTVREVYRPAQGMSMGTTSSNVLPEITICAAGGSTEVCLPVSNLTVENVTPFTASLSWVPGIREPEWEYAYGPADQEVEQLTVLSVASFNLTLEGLTPETDYVFYVRPACSTNSYGEWKSINFTTPYSCAVPASVSVVSRTSDSVVLAIAVAEGEPDVDAFNVKIWSNTDDERIVTGGDTIVIGGLNGSTTYKVAAQSNCGDVNGLSRWTAEVSFTTICDGTTPLPFTEDFSASSINAACWGVVVNDSALAQSGSLLAAPGVRDGHMSMATESCGSNGGQYFNRYFYSPSFEADDTLLVSFTYKTKTDYVADMYVGFSTTTGTDSADFEWTLLPQAGSATTYKAFVPATVKRMAVAVFDEDGNAYYFDYDYYIDDVSIKVADRYTIAASTADATMGSVVLTADGDTVDGETTVFEGTQVRMEAVPVLGYQFVNWTAGDAVISNNADLSFTPDKDTALVANFTLPNYYVMARVPNAQTDYGTAAVTKVGDNDTNTNRVNDIPGLTLVTLTAEDTDLSDNMVFRGWSKVQNNNTDIVSYDAVYTFPLVENTTLFAQFVTDSFNVALTYDTAMGTVNAAAISSTGKVVMNSRLQMTATEKWGYEFLGWYTSSESTEAISMNASIDTLVDGDKAFFAKFGKIPFYLRVSSNDTTVGTVSASATEGLYETPIVLTATPKAGAHHHFDHWNDGTTENPYNFILTQDTMMKAFFAIDTHKVELLGGADEFGTVAINGEETSVKYFDYGTENIAISATPNTGVTFTGWSDGVTDAERTLETLTGDVVLTANFDSTVYNVTVAYSTNEGVVKTADETTVENNTVYEKYYGDTVVLVAEASTGFNFSYWTDDADNTYTSDTLTYVVADRQGQTLRPVFGEAGKVTVYVRSSNTVAGSAIGNGTNGGVEFTTADTARFDVDGSFTVAATAADHYHFVNWTNANGDTLGTEPTLTYAVMEDYANAGDVVTFIANFAIDVHYLKVAVNDETQGSVTIDGVATDSVSVDYGTNVVLAATAAANHHFVSWNDGNTNADTTVAVTADMVLTAEFAIDVYTYTYTTNIEGAGTVTPSNYVELNEEEGYATFAFGSTATFEATANEGYVFTGWNAAGFNEATASLPVYSDFDLVANFDTIVYNVTTNVNAEQGTIEGPATIKHFLSGTYTAEANYGYTFLNWVDANGTVLGTEPTLTLGNLTSDTAIYAVFDSLEYTITVVSSNVEHGTVSGGATVKYLKTVTLTATPAEGYELVNWTNAAGTVLGTDVELTVTVERDSTITANFGLMNHTVTATVNNAEMGSVEGAGTTEHFATATLEATANYGYEFVNWTDLNGNVLGTETTLEVTVLSDTTVKANFQKRTFTATVVANNANMGIATVSGVATYLDTVTYTAQANAHYRFVNWTDAAGTAVGTETTLKVVVTSDTALTANFEAIMRHVTVSVNPANTGSVNVTDTNIADGQSLNLVATPADGYQFESWSNDANAGASQTIVVEDDMTIVANFSRVTYNITLVVTNNAMGTVNGGGVKASGDTITVTATAAQGYRFVSWTEDNVVVSTEADYTFVVTSARTLVANFIAVYTLTLDVNDATMGSVSPAGIASYDDNDEVVAVATANDGYHFVAWVNANNTNDTVSRSERYVFNIHANTSLIAVFARNTDGIDDVDMENVKIYSVDSKIIVRGAENRSVYVFDVNGRVVNSESNASETIEFRMANTGVYLVKVGNAPAKRVLVVR